ncbi:MAG TPA: hypothetical protein VGN37_11935 [Actinocatenispora sp.]
MEHDGPADFGDHDDEYAAEHDGDLAGDHGDDIADSPIDHDGAGENGDGDAGHGYDEQGYEPDDAPGDAHPVSLEFGDLSDEYGSGDGGHDAAAPDEPADADDPTADEHAEPVPGAEPDLDLVGDDPHWVAEDPFPPQLDVGEPPEPVDGFPWSDPAVLGEQHDTADAGTPGPVDAAPPPSDLLDYDAQDLPAGADPWQALAGSEDPATSSLARWWGPGD